MVYAVLDRCWIVCSAVARVCNGFGFSISIDILISLYMYEEERAALGRLSVARSYVSCARQPSRARTYTCTQILWEKFNSN